jgi:hypothetical protein
MQFSIETNDYEHDFLLIDISMQQGFISDHTSVSLHACMLPHDASLIRFHMLHY